LNEVEEIGVIVEESEDERMRDDQFDIAALLGVFIWRGHGPRRPVEVWHF
jgi:hypothetical protein